MREILSWLQIARDAPIPPNHPHASPQIAINIAN